MLNDFIPVRVSVNGAEHPNGVTIIPLADAHYGSQEFNEVRWHDAIKRIQDDPHCFCVLVGDLIDNGVKNSVTNIYEATCNPGRQKEWLVNELRPISGKILAAVGGNHEKRSLKDVDDDPLYDVMLAIGREAVYRKRIAFLALSFTYDFKGKDKPRMTYTFAITHGSGGGMYVGSGANRVQTFGTMIEGIDCIVTGHTHKPVSFPVSKLVFDTHAKTIEQKQFNVVVASSFLDYGGYPVDKLLTPTAHTLTEIWLAFDSNSHKQLRVTQ